MLYALLLSMWYDGDMNRIRCAAVLALLCAGLVFGGAGPSPVPLAIAAEVGSAPAVARPPRRYVVPRALVGLAVHGLEERTREGVTHDLYGSADLFGLPRHPHQPGVYYDVQTPKVAGAASGSPGGADIATWLLSAHGHVQTRGRVVSGTWPERTQCVAVAGTDVGPVAVLAESWQPGGRCGPALMRVQAIARYLRRHIP